jgi:hypothetical protein
MVINGIKPKIWQNIRQKLGISQQRKGCTGQLAKYKSGFGADSDFHLG